MRFRRLLAFPLILLSAQAFAEAPAFPAVRLAHPPTIDGVVNEKEWEGAPIMRGMVDRRDGAPAPDDAVFRIAYDERYIYIAAVLADKDPKGIRAVEFRTNVDVSNDDSIAFDIDPTGSLSENNEFSFNSRGATNVQLAGGRAAKREWLGDILSKGRITETGWEAEARIPWSILRLPGKGKRDARFNFSRNAPRSNRYYSLVYTNDGKQNDSPIWRDVVLPTPYVDRSIKLLPYFYGGYDPDTGYVANSGLDLKTAITDQIQLVGSVNPDFRNIENEILSLDFSRFERLAGEVRPFFLEGQDYLQNYLFTSQRIPSFDVGANVYGRLSDKTNFGVINTFDGDARYDDDHPRKGVINNFAGAITHTPDPNTSIRAAATSVSAPGLENQAYLLRGERQFGPFGVGLRTTGVSDTDFGHGVSHEASVFYQKQGLGGYSQYDYVEEGFVPRLGFIPERDYKGLDTGTFYNRNYDHGPLNSWGFFTEYVVLNHINGDFYRRTGYANARVTFRNQVRLFAGTNNEDFEGSRDWTYNGGASYPASNPYRNVGFNYTEGRQAGDHYQSASFYGNYRLGNRLQLSGNFQAVRYGEYTDQAILSANYDIDAYRSAGGRIVKTGPDVGGYISLRQSGNTGAEYFLLLGAPNAVKFRPSIILKVTIPFQIGK
ncbi:hypothetical protein BH11ARM2_BH11ARM2_10070 [soil metagenome]